MIFSKPYATRCLAFDVGSATVSASLFEFSGKNNMPAMINTFRRYHKVSPKKHSAYVGKTTLKLISDILEEVSEASKDNTPSLFIVGLSSVFYLGKTEKMSESFDKDTKLSSANIYSLIDRGRDAFLEDVKRDDIVVFESVPMEVRLNGYSVEAPIGKRAREIDLWIHYAATSKELHSSVIESISNINRGAKVHFSTFPLVTWSLMKDVLYPEHSVLVVDIGGETTEVTFLIDGVISDVQSLPFGVLNIILRIAESERIELEEAESLLKAYTSDDLDTDTAKNIQNVVKKEMKLWEQYFERIWQRASRKRMNSLRVFFLGGGAVIEEMRHSVIPPLLHPELVKGLNASIISPEAFKDKFSSYCCLSGSGDFGLLSLILNVQR